MIGLDEAREIFRSTDPAACADRCSDIDATEVGESGWTLLGEDLYFHEDRNLLAGPSRGELSRTVVHVALLRRDAADESPYDIAAEWDRQADTEPGVPSEARATPRPGTTEAPEDRKTASIRCTCDS